MAIYHLKVNVGKNGAQSAKAKCNYIAREGKYKTPKGADEVLHVSSGNMPGWAGKGRAIEYWQASDKFERKNGVLFREIEFALPKELSLTDNIALATSFGKAVCQEEGDTLPYTLAVHKGRNGNIHCHLMFSERRNDGHERTHEKWFRRAANKGKPAEAGGARKANLGVLQRRGDWLADTRELWAKMANDALSGLKGLRIDHRSYADQGSEKVAGIHIGTAVLALSMKGINTNKAEYVVNHERRNELKISAGRITTKQQHSGAGGLEQAIRAAEQAQRSAERAVAEVSSAAQSVVGARKSRYGWAAITDGISRIAGWAGNRAANVLQALRSAESASANAERICTRGLTYGPQ